MPYKNKEEGLTKRRVHRKLHWKRIYATEQAWSKLNRGRINARARAIRKKNPEKARQYQKQYRAAHAEEFKKRRLADTARILSRNRARKSLIKNTPSATSFYNFVRSKKSIPCYYCGKKISGKDAHIDHVIAVARHGNHASDNLSASCASCNLRKNDKLPSEVSFLGQPLLNL